MQQSSGHGHVAVTSPIPASVGTGAHDAVIQVDQCYNKYSAVPAVALAPVFGPQGFRAWSVRYQLCCCDARQYTELGRYKV